jgi:hypothetical protein
MRWLSRRRSEQQKWAAFGRQIWRKGRDRLRIDGPQQDNHKLLGELREAGRILECGLLFLFACSAACGCKPKLKEDRLSRGGEKGEALD